MLINRYARALNPINIFHESINLTALCKPRCKSNPSLMNHPVQTTLQRPPLTHTHEWCAHHAAKAQRPPLTHTHEWCAHHAAKAQRPPLTHTAPSANHAAKASPHPYCHAPISSHSVISVNNMFYILRNFYQKPPYIKRRCGCMLQRPLKPHFLLIYGGFMLQRPPLGALPYDTNTMPL